MNDISLHLLDLIENSIAAGCSTVAIEIFMDVHADLLRLLVDDDGKGMGSRFEDAVDPFFTTKQHKRVGLGLSLLQATAQNAGGSLTLEPSLLLEGVRVDVRMRLSHLDRPPLGDIAATISSMVAAHPDVEYRGRFRIDGHEVDFSTRRDLDLSNPVAASIMAYRVLRDSLQGSECA